MEINKKIAIIGKSASGKDYLAKFLEKYNLKRGISYTTRPIRVNEQNHIDYHFVSKTDFEDMINSGYMIEYNHFNDWYYGSSIDDFNNNDVFIKTVSGINQLKSYRNEIIIIYLDISHDTRYKRLLERNDNNDSINRRMEADDKDFEHFSDYDIYINDDNYNIEYIIEEIGKYC